jgi:hypothetical protein
LAVSVCPWKAKIQGPKQKLSAKIASVGFFSGMYRERRRKREKEDFAQK